MNLDIAPIISQTFTLSNVVVIMQSGSARSFDKNSLLILRKTVQ